MKKGTPLPLRMHFRTDLKPRVNFPLLATSWSLLLMLSVVFFYTALLAAIPHGKRETSIQLSQPTYGTLSSSGHDYDSIKQPLL